MKIQTLRMGQAKLKSILEIERVCNRLNLSVTNIRRNNRYRKYLNIADAGVKVGDVGRAVMLAGGRAVEEAQSFRANVVGAQCTDVDRPRDRVTPAPDLQYEVSGGRGELSAVVYLNSLWGQSATAGGRLKSLYLPAVNPSRTRPRNFAIPFPGSLYSQNCCRFQKMGTYSKPIRQLQKFPYKVASPHRTRRKGQSDTPRAPPRESPDM